MMFLKIFSLVLLCLFSVGLGQSNLYSISVTNGGVWGVWGPEERCPKNYVAKGFSIKVQPPQGLRDDTALNAIRLHCFPRSGPGPEKTVTSTEGPFGTWSTKIQCPSGFLIAFSLRVEPIRGSFRDDTAANNIKFLCSDGTMLEGPGLDWGFYGTQSMPCENGIYGIMTKVEGKQRTKDDTGLNDVQFICFDY